MVKVRIYIYIAKVRVLFKRLKTKGIKINNSAA